MLNREECEQACLYLLSHCYETDAPALENGDKDKTYTFTPAGFEESEIFKRLIEEHFTPQPLEFKDLKEGMYVLDWSLKNIIQIVKLHRSERVIIYKDFENKDNEIFTDYRKNRFYPIQIPIIEGDIKHER